MPGDTQFTFMPYLPSSCARDLTKAILPPFEAAYSEKPAFPCTQITDVIFIILPLPCSIIYLATILEHIIAPLRFTLRSESITSIS